MSKRKIEINKGAIQDNALKALVKSNVFRHKAHKNKKGKGAYSRKGRRQNPSGFPFTGKPDFFALPVCGVQPGRPGRFCCR